ncbi:MAG TPA: FKBP-type peptidyl-prolyl cis-trans isomerase, partial [Nitrososphaeraceae archaeon]|nr:FKBP-type peptidyl-prolyl cis-trans isomerase [Nitrososphaeraceae archaeon]
MPFEKGSLILLDYTARIKDNNEIFETTREEDAKNSNLYDPVRKYEPRLVSIGEGWVLRGVDEALSTANVGDKLVIEISPDKGFGDRDPNKIRMIAQRKLGEKAAEIKVGDVVEIDERPGIVRYIGSGRVQIDYNHRLASRSLVYDVNIIQKLDTNEEKIKNLMKRRLPLNEEKIKFEMQDDTLEIELPEDVLLLDGLQIIKRAISTDLFKFITSLKKIIFKELYSLPSSKGSQKLEATTAEATTAEATTAEATTAEATTAEATTAEATTAEAT